MEGPVPATARAHPVTAPVSRLSRGAQDPDGHPDTSLLLKEIHPTLGDQAYPLMLPSADTCTPWFTPPPEVLLKLTQPIVEDHAHPERFWLALASAPCGSASIMRRLMIAKNRMS